MTPSEPDGSEQPARAPLIATILATGLGTGYSPWASGTVGTLAALLLYFLIPGFEHPAVLVLIIVGATAAGVWSSWKVAQAVGHKLTRSAGSAKARFQPGTHEHPDPSIVVIDEFVGMWITLLLLPKTMVAVAVGFLAFRLFDIIKPPPARQLERLPDGWGIMLDDVVAGVYANITTHVCVAVIGLLLPSLL